MSNPYSVSVAESTKPEGLRVSNLETFFYIFYRKASRLRFFRENLGWKVGVVVFFVGPDVYLNEKRICHTSLLSWDSEQSTELSRISLLLAGASMPLVTKVDKQTT